MKNTFILFSFLLFMTHTTLVTSQLIKNHRANLHHSSLSLAPYQKHTHFMSTSLKNVRFFKYIFWQIFEREDEEKFFTHKNIDIAQIFKGWLEECHKPPHHKHISSAHYEGGLRDCQDILEQQLTFKEMDQAQRYMNAFLQFFIQGIEKHALVYIDEDGIPLGFGIDIQPTSEDPCITGENSIPLGLEVDIQPTSKNPGIMYGFLIKGETTSSLEAFFEDVTAHCNAVNEEQKS